MLCQTLIPDPNDACARSRVLPSRAPVLLSVLSSHLSHVASFTRTFTSFVSHLGDWLHYTQAPSMLYLLPPTHILSLCIRTSSSTSSSILIFFSTDVILSSFLSHTPSLPLLSALGLLGPLTSPLTHSNNCCPGPSSGKGCWSGNLPRWLRR